MTTRFSETKGKIIESIEIATTSEFCSVPAFLSLMDFPFLRVKIVRFSWAILLIPFLQLRKIDRAIGFIWFVRANIPVFALCGNNDIKMLVNMR